jgi:type 1 glutamine amidotransferase
MIDSFRSNVEYQWMTGAQWVSHPGNCEPTYKVDIVDAGHEITSGIDSFTLPDTEQYYCHHDPANHVLCTTTFDSGLGDTSRYRVGSVLPYAWTKTWGEGKVFGACWGHTFKDFDVPEAKQIVLNGMKWATR